MLDAEGHIKLVDFGHARYLKDDERSDSMVGTVHYWAPEQILSGHTHGKEVDWYALGVLIYELIFGAPPFDNDNEAELRKLILFELVYFPAETDSDLKDLLTGLLCKTSKDRLGTVGGVKAIQDHPWFGGVDWDAFEARKGNPPFIPPLGANAAAAAPATGTGKVGATEERKDSSSDPFAGF